ncbi:hypothetical protein [Streptomyces sp. NPDC051572]|uniref:hypothetical protein n=1 Tax=Streptomyces sp. NPDC051572 TaxID=3155802 RepID=UPI00344F4FBE
MTAALNAAETLPVKRLPAEPLYPWLPVINVDKDYAASVDLSRPVLVAEVADMRGHTILIDGWHRLYLAYTRGLAHLPCKVLNPEQEFSVRVFGGRKGSLGRARAAARRLR